MVTATISSENKNSDNSIWDKIPWKIIAYVVLALIGTVVFALLTGAGAKRICNCNFSINLSSPKHQQNKGYQSFDRSNNQGTHLQPETQSNQSNLLIGTPHMKGDENFATESQPPYAPSGKQCVYL